MQVFSETTYSTQIKLIGQSLCVSEHGIGFAANKGQKRLIFSFQSLKCLERLDIQSQCVNMKRFLIKTPLILVIFIWPSWLMKTIKAYIYFCHTNVLRIRDLDSIQKKKRFHYRRGFSIMVNQSWHLQLINAKIKAEDFFIQSHQHDVERDIAKLRIFNLRCDLKHIPYPRLQNATLD